MLPFKLFQSKQILGLCFASFPVFWSDTDNWTFGMFTLSPWACNLTLLTCCRVHSLTPYTELFKLFKTLLLCILQGLHPSGFSLCITRIKNLFFWKEIDKTFLLLLCYVSFARCFACDVTKWLLIITPSGFTSFYSLRCIAILVARFHHRVDLLLLCKTCKTKIWFYIPHACSRLLFLPIAIPYTFKFIHQRIVSSRRRSRKWYINC